jgi:hypothetical protein
VVTCWYVECEEFPFHVPEPDNSAIPGRDGGLRVLLPTEKSPRMLPLQIVEGLPSAHQARFSTVSRVGFPHLDATVVRSHHDHGRVVRVDPLQSRDPTGAEFCRLVVTHGGLGTGAPIPNAETPNEQ